jgi:hypothetical protein
VFAIGIASVAWAVGRNLAGSILCDFSVPFVAGGKACVRAVSSGTTSRFGGRAQLADGPFGRLFWRTLDALDYWLTQARLWLVDAVCGPEPETDAD